MLCVDNISFSILPGQELHGISFTAKPGEMIAVLSTGSPENQVLMKILNSEVKPDRGSIHFGPGGSADRIRTFAFSNLFARQSGFTRSAGSVKDMIREYFLRFENKSRDMSQILTEQVLSKSGTSYLKNRLIASLSEDEYQKVQLSMVFAQLICRNRTERGYLILDEPVNKLESLDKHRILQQADEFRKCGNTVISALNDISLAAAYADKVLLLKNGRQFAFGPVNDVFTTALISKFYETSMVVTRYPMSDRPVVQFGETEPRQGETSGAFVLGGQIEESNGMQRIFMMIGRNDREDKC